MKNIKLKLLAIIVATLFFACASKRASVKINDKSEIKTETAVTRTAETTADVKVTDKSETLTDKSLTQIESESNEFEKRITLYDTDKGIIPGTTLPPVKSITVITNKKLSKKDTQNLDNSKIKNSTESSLSLKNKSEMDSLKKVDSRLTSKLENITIETNNNWWKWFLAGMCLPILILLFWKIRKSMSLQKC